MGHFLRNMYGGQTPEDLNQNSWGGVWPVYQCFVLFLGSEYDYNVRLHLRTVEQTWANSQLQYFKDRPRMLVFRNPGHWDHLPRLAASTGEIGLSSMPPRL